MNSMAGKPPHATQYQIRSHVDQNDGAPPPPRRWNAPPRRPSLGSDRSSNDSSDESNPRPPVRLRLYGAAVAGATGAGGSGTTKNAREDGSGAKVGGDMGVGTGGGDRGDTGSGRTIGGDNSDRDNLGRDNCNDTLFSGRYLQQVTT